MRLVFHYFLILRFVINSLSATFHQFLSTYSQRSNYPPCGYIGKIAAKIVFQYVNVISTNYPQVLWTQKAKFYKPFRAFFTYTQALLLLLDLNKVLFLGLEEGVEVR